MKFRNVLNSAKAHLPGMKANVLMGATALSTMPGFALAQSGDFDATEIIAKTVTYTAIGVAILGAFALATWTLRAMGLVGGKR